MNGFHYASAFVIQFRMDGDRENDKLGGRAEHVASGDTASFQSVDELPRLLRRMLKGVWQVEQSEI
jgi:hypothetical protein